MKIYSINWKKINCLLIKYPFSLYYYDIIKLLYKRVLQWKQYTLSPYNVNRAFVKWNHIKKYNKLINVYINGINQTCTILYYAYAWICYSGIFLRKHNAITCSSYFISQCRRSSSVSTASQLWYFEDVSGQLSAMERSSHEAAGASWAAKGINSSSASL